MTRLATTLLALFLLLEGVSGCGPGRIPWGPGNTRPFQIRGTVHDAASHPLPDVMVEVLSGSEAGLSTRSNDAGAFTLTGVFNYGEFLRASKEGYVPKDIPFAMELPIVLETLEPQADLRGEHILTITADSACVELPNEARTRTYTATIATSGGSVGPGTFVTGGHGEVLNRFATNIAGSHLTVTTEFDGSPTLFERLSANTYLAVLGSAQASVEAGSAISAPFAGWIEHCVLDSEIIFAYSCPAAAKRSRCTSTNHRLILTPR